MRKGLALRSVMTRARERARWLAAEVKRRLVPRGWWILARREARAA